MERSGSALGLMITGMIVGFVTLVAYVLGEIVGTPEVAVPPLVVTGVLFVAALCLILPELIDEISAIVQMIQCCAFSRPRNIEKAIVIVR